MENTKLVENKESQTGKGFAENALKRSVAGGIIGVAAGYFATPENGKKVAGAMKKQGAAIGRTAKETSKKSFKTVKNKAGDLIKRKDKAAENENIEEKQEVGAKNQESGEMEELNNRLDRLEDMLASFIEEQGGNKQGSKEKKAAETTSQAG